MSATLAVILAGIAGFAAALIYFTGLRLTVQALGSVQHPAGLLLASLLLRLAVLLSVLWLVASWTGAAGLITALVGVIVARTLVVRWTSSALRPRPRAGRGSPDSYTRSRTHQR